VVPDRVPGDSSGMRLRERVARNLRRLRQEKSLSQEELADRADINRNYVGMLEREENAATVDMLEKLAAVLEVDPVELLRRDKD
jgi:transcriptional regulator with XRE-family HTH domain